MSGPLSAWRVADLTDLRGAMCGRILADLGADVLKVDDPGTDRTSLAYRYRNANKRGAIFRGIRHLDSILEAVDVLVENSGLDAEGLEQRHPHLVHVALSDFGLSGPRSRWRLEPLTALAASGTLHASGFPDLPPCWLPGYLAHDCASMYGAIGAVAAMMERRRSGSGQMVEVSVQEAALAGTVPWSLVLEDYTRVNPLLPTKGSRNADGSYWVMPAADGWVRTVIGNARQWRGFLAMLSDAEALSGPEWKDPVFRLMNGDVVRMIASEHLADRTRAELFEESRHTGATIGVIHRPSEFVAHEQTRARGVFEPSTFAGFEGAPFVMPPLRLSATPSELRRPAPEPQEDDSAPAKPAPSTPAAGGEGLLLEGVRVVEFGMAAVVPELCMVLSELGADVIKVESSVHLDVLRATGMGRINCGFAFNAECRGRRSIVLNLDTDEGRRLAFALCSSADVVAENFRGGVLDKLGLGYDAVKDANPSVIYASSQGYGRGGPLGEMPAYGPLNLGFAGLHHLWGHPGAPYPCGTSLNHPDHIAGKLLAVGVLAALDHRARTGEGQLVDMAQVEVGAFLMGEVYLEGHLAGSDLEPAGNASETAVPHGAYQAAGDDRWVAIAVADDGAWLRLCDALGWEPDPSLETLAGRLERREEIDKRVGEWTIARPATEAARFLQERGVSAMEVMGPEEHHADAHLAERGFIVELEHPEVGRERHPGNPLRMSRLAQRTAASAPCLGANTEDVLVSVLGIDPDEVARLVAAGVCS